MGIFRKRKKLSFLDKQKKLDLKSKRKITGKTSIAQTKSPYSLPHNNEAFSSQILKRRKRFKKLPQSALTNPPKRLTQTNSSFWKKLLISIVLIISTIGATYILFFSEIFIIYDFTIYDEETEITSNLFLNNLISKALLNQNLILYNEKNLSKLIIQSDPRYKIADIKKIYPHSIEINLEKYPVIANLVENIQDPDGLRIEKKFGININGMLITENDEDPNLPYIRLESNKPLKLNEFPINKEKLDYIIKLVNLFEEKFGLKVIEIKYLKVAKEVHLKTERDFDVWFDMSKDMLIQVDKLKRALPKLDIYNLPIQYIDLRITSANAEKVIYKLK